MYAHIGSAITQVVRFTNEHRIDAEFHLHTANQLRGGSDNQKEYWSRFEKKAGVYLIFSMNDETVRYVGMSERDTGSRLFMWMFKENKVQESVQDQDIVLSVVLADQPYMAPALESFLISELQPVLNVRGNR